jgi:hypothetical protein
LTLVEAHTRRRTNTYHGLLYDGPLAWFLQTPLAGKGERGYYPLMSAFAIVRAIHERLGEKSSQLDATLSEITRRVQSGHDDPADHATHVLLPHRVMRELQILGPGQIKDWEALTTRISEIT